MKLQVLGMFLVVPCLVLSGCNGRPAAVSQTATEERREFVPAPNPEMILIKAGSFVMGSPISEAGRNANEAQISVTIEKDFYIGKYEITVGQFRTFCVQAEFRSEHERDGDSYDWDHPLSKMAQTEDHPALAISWNDAQAYCQWLSRTTGDRYRLPTEVEWEYACRAGTTTAFHTGETLSPSNAAFGRINSFGSGRPRMKEEDTGTLPVGKFKPNAFGLYDMHGNAFEWCSDVFKEQEHQEPKSDKYHTIRGGSWSMDDPKYCRSAYREGFSGGNAMTGFRVVKEVD